MLKKIIYKKKLRWGKIRRLNAGHSEHIFDLSLHPAIKVGPLILSLDPLLLSLGPLRLKLLFYRSLTGPKLGDLSLELRISAVAS